MRQCHNVRITYLPVALLLLACSPGFGEIRWAGDSLIDLDATGFFEGDLSAWESTAGAGHTFNSVDPAAELPQVRSVTPGTAGTTQQVVHFNGTNMLVGDSAAPAGITMGGAGPWKPGWPEKRQSMARMSILPGEGDAATSRSSATTMMCPGSVGAVSRTRAGAGRDQSTMNSIISSSRLTV